MTHKMIVLALAIALAGATAAQALPPVLFFEPDLEASVSSSGAIGVHNIGDADVNSSFVVRMTCHVVVGARGQQCGDPFSDGLYLKTLTLPAGFNQPWYVLTPGAQTLIQYGKGWAVIYPAIASWPKGTYSISVTADDGNIIKEKVETNNAASATVIRQ